MNINPSDHQDPMLQQSLQALADAIIQLSTIYSPKKEEAKVQQSSEFINLNAAAAWLGISRRSMQRYVQMNLLPSYKLGKQRLFRRKELLDALGANRMATRAEILR
jgi:excisionase family DNA binding protein